MRIMYFSIYFLILQIAKRLILFLTCSSTSMPMKMESRNSSDIFYIVFQCPIVNSLLKNFLDGWKTCLELGSHLSAWPAPINLNKWERWNRERNKGLKKVHSMLRKSRRSQVCCLPHRRWSPLVLPWKWKFKRFQMNRFFFHSDESQF